MTFPLLFSGHHSDCLQELLVNIFAPLKGRSLKVTLLCLSFDSYLLSMSVCPSVCLSVCLYVTKMDFFKEISTFIFSFHILIFWYYLNRIHFRLKEWLYQCLSHCLIDCFTKWFIDLLIYCLIQRFTTWKIHWSTD